jgi:hypothetical protein
MKLPRFTAEAALYQTSGCYRTGRHSYAIHVAARMAEAIHPAKEVIEVHGCSPGSFLVEYDDGTWDCLPNEEPMGGGGGGAPFGGGEPSGGGGAGRPSKKPPKRPPTPPRPKKKVYAPTQGAPCHAELIETSGDVVFTEQITSKGDYVEIGPSDPQPGWHCAYTDPGGPRTAHCNEVKVEGGSTKRIRCYNGHDKEW